MSKNKKTTRTGFMPAVKTIGKSLGEYKKAAIVTPFFMIGEVILECLIPLIMSKLLEAISYIDALCHPGTDASAVTLANTSGWIKSLTDSVGGANGYIWVVLIFGGVLLLIATLSLLCGAGGGKYCSLASSGLAKNLRKNMYYNIQDFSFANIDKFSTSSLVTRLTTDVSNVQMAFMMIIRTAIRGPLLVVFSIVMSFSVNAQMALIFLATTPILAVGLTIILAKAVPFFNRIFPKYDFMNESVQENIRGMRVIKSYVREDYEKEKFNKTSDNVRKDFVKAEKIVALTMPLMNFCIYVGLIAIYLVSSLIISRDVQNNVAPALKVTEIQMFMTYSFQMLMGLMVISMVMVQILLSTASVRRIHEVLTEESTIKNPANPVTDVKNGSVEFVNAGFKYNEKAEKFALSGANIKINSGETVGVIGGTGSSKTTFVQLIPRLYDVTEGEVKVAGVNVKDYDIDTLRNAVAMVLQKNVLFSGTIADNMRWGNENATEDEIMEACDLAQASEFIKNNPLGLNRELEQGGTNVSGGQKQRLCIARALLKKPKILILDDSTSAVDTKTDALIRSGLKKYVPETTKIIIAQRIASIMDADKIIILDGGTISAVGTHDELLQNNEIYRELYYSQNSEEKKEANRNAR